MRLLLAALLLILATGCSSRRPPTSVPQASGPKGPSIPQGPVVAPQRPPTTTRQPTATRQPAVAPRPRARARDTNRTARRAVEKARSLLGTPYRYGGESRRGMDCSGLTSTLFSNLGVPLPRTAQQQASAGFWVAPDELRPGDLAFFGDGRDRLYHVGLVVSSPGQPLTIVHSTESRGVVETNVTASKYWLSRFKFGRRVLPE